MANARDQARVAPGAGEPGAGGVARSSGQKPTELTDLNAEVTAQIEQAVGVEEFRTVANARGVDFAATLTSEAVGRKEYFLSQTQPEIQAMRSAWQAIEALHDNKQAGRAGPSGYIRIVALAELASFPVLYAGFPWLFEALDGRIGIDPKILLLCALGISIAWLQSLVLKQLAVASGVEGPPKLSASFVSLVLLAASAAVVLIPLVHWLRAGSPYAFGAPVEISSVAFGLLVLGYLYMRLAFWSTFPRMLRVYIRPKVRHSMRQIGAASPWELTMGATTGVLLASVHALYRGKAAADSEEELQVALERAVGRWQEAVRERAILPFLRARVGEITTAQSHLKQREAFRVLTPQDIRNKQFSTTRLRPGYDELEVDSFLDEVEAEIDRLIDENEELRAKLSEVLRGRSGTSALSSPAMASAPAPAVSDDFLVGPLRRDRDSVTREIPRWPYGPIRRARDSVVSGAGGVIDGDTILEEDVAHADGVMKRFNFGSGGLVLIDRTAEGDTINWSSPVTPRSFVSIAQELFRSRDDVQAQVSIDGNLAEMGGNFLFGLAESMSENFDATCEFIRFDTRESCIAFQILPSAADVSEGRFVGVSAKKVAATVLIPILLRTASPVIVERALGLSDDSFMARMGVLLGTPIERSGEDEHGQQGEVS